VLTFERKMEEWTGGKKEENGRVESHFIPPQKLGRAIGKVYNMLV
jgi:hypothetical protein